MAKGGKPFGKALLLEMPHPLVSVLGGAVERGPPLNERGAIRDDRRDPYRRHIVLDRKRRGAAECVAIGTLDVGMGEQHLADDVSPEADPAHGPHLISRLAAFDDGLALDARPSIVIERADHRPHFIGRMVEHHAVIGSCHCSKPPPPSTRGLVVAPRRKLRRSVSCGSILAQCRRDTAPVCARGRASRAGSAPRLIPTDSLTIVREWIRSRCAACAASTERSASASARSRTIFSIATVHSGKRGFSTKSGPPARRSAICARDWSSIPVTSVASCARSNVNGWCERNPRRTMAVSGA